MKVNAGLLSDMYPQLLTQVDIAQELDIEINLVKPTIVFGPTDRNENMQISFDVQFGVKKHNDMNYLVYDMFQIESFANFEVRDEVVFAEITDLRAKPFVVEGKPARNLPIQNTIGI